MIIPKGVTPTITILLALTFLTIQPVHAGWIMEDADGTTTYLAKGKVKAVLEMEGMNLWHIMDSHKGLITMVDPKKKIYGSGTPEDFCNAMKSFGEDMKNQAMAGLSPEQRKMMEEQMKQYEEMMKSAPQSGNPAKPPVSIKKTGEGEIIANHKTDQYTITVDGEPYEKIWITSDLSLAKEEKALKLHKVHHMQKRMDSCMDMSEEEMGIMADPLESPEYKKITDKGIVLREIVYAGGYPHGGGERSTDIVRLEKKNIPASEFSIPSGFKKVPIQNILKGMMGEGGM